MNSENKILVAIVPQEAQSSVIDFIISCGVKKILSFDARGTAEKALLERLGLGQTKKTLIAFTTGNENTTISDEVFKSLLKNTDFTGIGFTIDIEGKNMEQSEQNLIVCVIVNAGYAESVMQEARKAGARGGTIINARGTGKEQDMDFFGIQIVPEKEMLVMVAEKDLAKKLVEVVKSMPLLSTPGSGLVFSVTAETFSRLGGSAS